jgi:hypothetical protein
MVDLIITGQDVTVIEVKNIREHMFRREENRILFQFKDICNDYIKSLKRHYKRRKELI